MGTRRKTGAEQLEWAARNMHEWPDSAEEAGYVWENQVRFTTFNSPTPPGCVLFSRQQWLDRRAELQNKPSWLNLDPKIKWVAQDDDGEWFGFLGKPRISAAQLWQYDCGLNDELLSCGEVLGEWRDTLEERPEADIENFASKIREEIAACNAKLSEDEAAEKVKQWRSSNPEITQLWHRDQPLTREQALQWTIDNVEAWHKAPLGPWPAPSGWSWEQACGNIYLMQVGEPCIGEMEWKRAKREQTTRELNTMLEGSGFEPFTSLEDSQPEPTLHAIHHAAFLHQGCRLLLSEPELVVFRTADGELIHCKPKKCLIDPDVYGLAARLLADMSGHPVAPEHMREVAEQMNWRVE